MIKAIVTIGEALRAVPFGTWFSFLRADRSAEASDGQRRA